MKIKNDTDKTILLEPGNQIITTQAGSHIEQDIEDDFAADVEELLKVSNRVTNISVQNLENEDVVKQQSSGIDDAYEDRNLAVLAYLKAQHDLSHEISSKGGRLHQEAGWCEAPGEKGDEWVIVWEESATKQKSWHVPRELVEDLTWLNEKEHDFDGHTRKQKNNRLRRFIGAEEK